MRAFQAIIRWVDREFKASLSNLGGEPRTLIAEQTEHRLTQHAVPRVSGRRQSWQLLRIGAHEAEDDGQKDATESRAH